ncbi:hypothetical protein [Streptomyces phaeochromogenes]|uniref:hypothetical protein n=1 Tax=Streptomyces phaeochromogenes TaxID=1923 RepID=UPI0033C12088|nr:hypothetical protein OG478_49360 [Streptomyces phaeochromogenes]WSW20646.1 hypothetical protein OG277_51020 [Streptomyces phaeochromogenes]
MVGKWDVGEGQDDQGGGHEAPQSILDHLLLTAAADPGHMVAARQVTRVSGTAIPEKRPCPEVHGGFRCRVL